MATAAGRLVLKEKPGTTGHRAENQKRSGNHSYHARGRKAKTLQSVASLRLQWPKTAKDRRELADAWHSVAMQVLNDARYSFRLVSPLLRFLNWESGSLWPSNRTLADHAGQCSEDTISIDIGAFAKLGLLQIEEVDQPGSNFKQRILWLSLPASVTDTVSAPEDIVDADTVSEPVTDTVSDTPSDTVSEQPKNRPLKETSERAARAAGLFSDFKERLFEPVNTYLGKRSFKGPDEIRSRATRNCRIAFERLAEDRRRTDPCSTALTPRWDDLPDPLKKEAVALVIAAQSGGEVQ